MTFTTTILAAPVPVEKRPVDSISEYYSVDTTDHTIDVGDTALIFFLGPWEKARPLAPSQALARLNDLRQCVGPDGVITDLGQRGLAAPATR